MQRLEERTAEFIAPALVNPAFLLLTGGREGSSLVWVTHGEQANSEL